MDQQLKDFVKTNMGEPALNLLEKRRMGGDNNAKGNQHELFFAAYKLAELSALAIKGQDVQIKTQSDAFVDDLEIKNNSISEIQNFQLKDSQYIPWGVEGISGICFDFQRQHQLNIQYHNAKKSRTILVVSNNKQHLKLKQEIPALISKHTKCEIFENIALNVMLLEKPHIREAIASICSYPNDTDKLYNVYQLLVSVVATSSSDQTCVLELLKKAKEVGRPEYFISLSEEPKLPEFINNFLNKWDNITYSVENRRLLYSTDSVQCISNFNVDDYAFSDNFTKIIESNPKNTTTLIILLMENT